MFSAATSASAINSPAGPISRITSGETGSLKVSFSAAGACASTAPSAGSAFTSDACAQACAPLASKISNERRKAALRARMPRHCLGNSFNPGAGSG